MQPNRLTPEILQALQERRMGGVGGGGTMPAAAQTMPQNPFGGPVGPTTSPLQAPPQAMPAGQLPMPQGPPGAGQVAAGPSGQQQQQPGAAPRQGQQSAMVDEETRSMTKALMQRLLRFV